MLSKKYRLGTEREISCIMRTGKTGVGPFFILKWIPNNKENSRFVFIVSTKVDKRAVIRNKIQRQFREVVARNLSKLKGNFDIAMIAKSKSINVSFEDINNSFYQILAKNKLITESK